MIEVVPSRRTKCVGRFPEIRDGLVDTVDAIFRTDDPNYQVIIKNHLDDIYSLIEQDIPHFDVKDPYMHNQADQMRTDFAKIAEEDISLSIVPLITTDIPVNATLVLEYAKKFGINKQIQSYLPLFFKEVDKTPDGAERLDIELDVRMHDIAVPHKDDPKNTVPLHGYKIAAGFGIGPNKLGTLAYDAPFHIELHSLDSHAGRFEPRNEKSGALGIGFWINNDNEMLVGQIQAMRGAHLPADVKLGTVALLVAEKVARKIGFKTISTYSANEHPQFRMHPESRNQMIGDFRCYHDSSAKSLGWEPIDRKTKTSTDQHIGYRRVL